MNEERIIARKGGSIWNEIGSADVWPVSYCPPLSLLAASPLSHMTFAPNTGSFLEEAV